MIDNAQLSAERRGFIKSSLIVLLVCNLATALIEVIMLAPQLLAPPLPTSNMERAQRATAALATIANDPPLVLMAVWLAGAVALFLLNRRFSLLLGRPARVLQEPRTLGATIAWHFVLILNSLLYGFWVPELVLMLVLARWGQEEIDRRAPPPPLKVEMDAGQSPNG